MLSSTLSTLVLSASLASGVLATQQWTHVLPRELMPRQDQSFAPGTSSGSGSTCQEAFGGASKLCADSDVCYDESLGDSCCSEGYPCPSGSFCLVQGLCCPDGVDPATCATDNGIKLPANFDKSQTKAPPPAQPTETTASVEVSSAPATAAPSVSPTVAPPFPIPSVKPTGPAASGTAPAGSAAASGTGAPRTSSTIAPFTGAASSLNFAGALFGGLLCLAGMMAVL